MEELYNDAANAIDALYNHYLRTNQKEFSSIAQLLASHSQKLSYIDQIGRTLQEIELVEYQRDTQHGYIKITDKGIEIMQKFGSIGRYYEFLERERTVMANNNTPAKKPTQLAQAAMAAYKEIKSFFIFIKDNRYSLIAGLLFAVAAGILAALFQYRYLSTPPKDKASNTPTGKHTKTKINPNKPLQSDKVKKSHI